MLRRSTQGRGLCLGGGSWRRRVLQCGTGSPSLRSAGALPKGGPSDLRLPAADYGPRRPVQSSSGRHRLLPC